MLPVILVFLATYRLTRLLVEDAFPPIKYQREVIVSRYGTESWQAYLVNCPWCVSVYVGGLVVLATVIVSDLPLPVWTWMSASAATGIIATVVEE